MCPAMANGPDRKVQPRPLGGGGTYLKNRQRGGSGVGIRPTTKRRSIRVGALPPPPTHNQNTFGPTEGQNEQWREANRRRQRQTIRYRGLVPNPPPPTHSGVLQ